MVKRLGGIRLPPRRTPCFLRRHGVGRVPTCAQAHVWGPEKRPDHGLGAFYQVGHGPAARVVLPRRLARATGWSLGRRQRIAGTTGYKKKLIGEGSPLHGSMPKKCPRERPKGHACEGRNSHSFVPADRRDFVGTRPGPQPREPQARMWASIGTRGNPGFPTRGPHNAHLGVSPLTGVSVSMVARA